ncbi:hypothetical protein C2I18_11880 [Paenibacillus sp. PK3_47]|uniref:hypothetical protein n=1 Tax=Paenibacillus sp. PK3_47 TaxID=2072642 RepID=UPI00201D7699|nr:hypothetical protein [Paenibacillus sp. PK3_47]UQZ34166.1 hypothetical protein C2I18_11880 [Paenibacillus sp. PK3_47]
MKIAKYLLGVCLVAVLASGLSILTTAYVVNTYIHSVLASFDIKLDTPGPGIGGFMKSLTGTATKVKEDTAASGEDQKAAPTAVTDTEEEDENTGAPVEEKVPEDALAVMGQADAAEEQSSGGQEQQLVMTPGDMSDLKNSLPTDEKANIFNILMTKLPQEEMQKISTAMEDGLTENEVLELQQVIAKYVSDEEYNTLMKMLTPNFAQELPN